MSPWLQLLLGLCVAVATGFLLPFLVQLRRTAAAVERLAESAARDLGRIAEDVHATRLQADEVAGLARRTLEHPSTLTKVVAGVLGAFPLLLGKGGEAPNILGTLLTGLRTALHLFRRARRAPGEGCHE